MKFSGNSEKGELVKMRLVGFESDRKICFTVFWWLAGFEKSNFTHFWFLGEGHAQDRQFCEPKSRLWTILGLAQCFNALFAKIHCQNLYFSENERKNVLKDFQNCQNHSRVSALDSQRHFNSSKEIDQLRRKLFRTKLSH